MTDLNRIRQLAGILTESVVVNEEMAQAQKVKGKWTDGNYTEGDSIAYRGLSWNLEWEAGQPLNDDGTWTEGAWYAVGDDGDEIEFSPGMEDRHDPMTPRPAAFPESKQVNEASESAVKDYFDKMRDFAERWEKAARPGGFLERQIDGIGGDPSGLADIRKALEDLYRAVDEADYAARSHLSSED